MNHNIWRKALLLVRVLAITLMLVFLASVGFGQKTKTNPCQTGIGTVRLKITFLANGKIGDIVDVTKKCRDEFQKLGLTAKAIEAAHQIKFEPEKRNGVPVDSIHVVEYGFKTY